MIPIHLRESRMNLLWSLLWSSLSLQMHTSPSPTAVTLYQCGNLRQIQNLVGTNPDSLISTTFKSSLLLWLL